MVLLYSPPKQKQAQSVFVAEILDLDYQGVGVAKVQGKTWFIENALPKEKVEVQVIEEKRQYGRGVSKKILQISPERQTPKCKHYWQCGGCQCQHISVQQQQAAKESALFHRLVKLQPDVKLMPILTGESWHYRRRIKLSIQYDPKTQRLKIGFRQKNSQQIVSVQQCPVAESAINHLLPKLTALLSLWTLPKQLGHLEIVRAENTLALLLRHIGALSELDRQRLLAFAQQENLSLFVQEQERVEHLLGELPYYCLNDGSRLYFDIRDFIQVNDQLNQTMIDTALDWLDLQPADQVLDLFCGMGNFTLPLSRQTSAVVGIEGVEEMVKKAQKNAEQNQCDNVKFFRADLALPFMEHSWAKIKFNKILLDPARSGAAFALQHLCQLQAEKILYVSCNPASLVRDAEILLAFGYRLKKVAMIDMFPHTGHLESISLFELK